MVCGLIKLLLKKESKLEKKVTSLNEQEVVGLKVGTYNQASINRN